MSSSGDFIEFLKGLSEPTATPKIWMWMRDGLSPRVKERILTEAPGSLAAKILTGRVDDQNVAPLTIGDADSVPLPSPNDEEEDFRCTTPTASTVTMASSAGIVGADNVLDAEFSGNAVICWHSDEGFYAQPLKHATEIFVCSKPEKPIHIGDWIRYKSVRQGQLVTINDYEVTEPHFPTSSANGSTTVQCSMIVPGLGGPPFNGYLLSQISPMTCDPLRRIQLDHCGETVQVILKFCYEHGAECGYWQIEEIQWPKTD